MENKSIKKPEIVVFAGPNGSGTVSYTHLDVYKRQKESSLEEHPDNDAILDNHIKPCVGYLRVLNPWLSFLRYK